ncbi:unnamed protein product [Penicillium glandicola]
MTEVWLSSSINAKKTVQSARGHTLRLPIPTPGIKAPRSINPSDKGNDGSPPPDDDAYDKDYADKTTDEEDELERAERYDRDFSSNASGSDSDSDGEPATSEQDTANARDIESWNKAKSWQVFVDSTQPTDADRHRLALLTLPAQTTWTMKDLGNPRFYMIALRLNVWGENSTPRNKHPHKLRQNE